MKQLACCTILMTCATLSAACHENDWLATFENQPLHVVSIETTTGISLDTTAQSIDGSTVKLDGTSAFSIHAASTDRFQTGASIVASVDPSFGLIVNQAPQPTDLSLQFDLSSQASGPCEPDCARLHGAGLGLKLSALVRREGDQLRFSDLIAAGETVPGVGLLTSPTLGMVAFVVGP